MKVLKSHRCFDGLTQFWEHESKETKTTMKFSSFVPQGDVRGCLIFLSGLTCNEENFISKAGAQRYLAEAQLMVICPDTSPRGLNLPDEHASWDFGSGAGFYLNASTPGYRDHYRMYSYVVDELYHLIESHFNMAGRISISGHSMGGHGALLIGLRNRDKFQSISAFSPIVNPIQCPWGKKAFAGYLGSDVETWKQYDACELLATGFKHPSKILIDQGTEDSFLESELLTDNLIAVCLEQDQALQANFREGYDHGYYFISTFIGNHIKFHMEAIQK